MQETTAKSASLRYHSLDRDTQPHRPSTKPFRCPRPSENRAAKPVCPAFATGAPRPASKESLTIELDLVPHRHRAAEGGRWFQFARLADIPLKSRFRRKGFTQHEGSHPSRLP